MKSILHNILAWLLAPLLSIAFWAVLIWVAVVIISGCTIRRPAPVPPAPTKTTQHVADAQQIAGALTDKARIADERGLIPKSTDSGTLVKLAVTNEQYVGSPAVRVDAENPQVIAALIGSMQRQEEQYRQDRAAWEQRVDALSRDRDRAVVEASGFGAQVKRLKAWLFWGAVLLVVVCFLCPGLIWVLIRFVGGRARAHISSMVEGIEAFREENRDIAPRLESYLSRKMDNSTKRLVKQVKIDRGL